jgi:hypothetical protein
MVPRHRCDFAKQFVDAVVGATLLCHIQQGSKDESLGFGQAAARCSHAVAGRLRLHALLPSKPALCAHIRNEQVGTVFDIRVSLVMTFT